MVAAVVAACAAGRVAEQAGRQVAVVLLERAARVARAISAVDVGLVAVSMVAEAAVLLGDSMAVASLMEQAVAGSTGSVAEDSMVPLAANEMGQGGSMALTIVGSMALATSPARAACLEPTSNGSRTVVCLVRALAVAP